MTAKNLRYGYTTGACAAAAAKGAAQMLREQSLVGEAELLLPSGEAAHFLLHGQEFTENFASCFVVKDAGDDPDVTNGAEVHAAVTLNPPLPPFCKGGGIIVEGGVGVGKVTKPGLAVPVGEWAINPVPRRMITDAVLEIFSHYPSLVTCRVVLSIPNGAELAKRTLNARLGIVGGLSILGTTGIVKPISAKAWTDTIDTAIDVALACGCTTIVLSTGRTSELVAQKFLQLTPPPLMGGGWGEGEIRGGRNEKTVQEEAFIMMGDHAGYALGACVRKGVRQVVIAGQFAKLLKIGCGHEQTHVSSSELDLKMLAQWVVLEPRTLNLEPVVRQANTARQVLVATGNAPALAALVCGKVLNFAKKLAPRLSVKVLLAGYAGEVVYFG